MFVNAVPIAAGKPPDFGRSQLEIDDVSLFQTPEWIVTDRRVPGARDEYHRMMDILLLNQARQFLIH